MSDSPQIGDLMSLLSPAGLNQIAEVIDTAKRERGQGWIEALREEYPTASWMIDLAANYTGEDAFAALAAAYPHYPLYLAKGRILDLHAFLREQIDRPREVNQVCS